MYVTLLDGVKRKNGSIENYQCVRPSGKPSLFHTSQYGNVDQRNKTDTFSMKDGCFWMDGNDRYIDEYKFHFWLWINQLIFDDWM